MPTARARTLADRLARVFTALWLGAACALSGAARAQRRPAGPPWWGAPPDAVDEVQLVRTNEANAALSWVAVYRGGGTELAKIRAAPVDMSGSWGREAAPPRELGERARTAPWTVRSVAGVLTLL